MNTTINIRAIQHYMYCQRRYALLEINNDWAENAFVVKANIMHENVHSGERNFSDNRRIVRSAVSIYNDDPVYDIYGVADCIEFVRSADGDYISRLNGNYTVNIVEFKPQPPKCGDFHESDAIQVFAQKICVDYVFKCNSVGYLYYSKTRRRVKLPFEEEYKKYDNQLIDYLTKMRNILESAEIPLRIKGQKCSGCSISDLCFPKGKDYDVREAIMSMNGDDCP